MSETDYTSGFRAGQVTEKERIIGLMTSHRVVVHFDGFNMRFLICVECGDVTDDQPSHLMRLIKEGE